MNEWEELRRALADPWCKCKERKGLESDIREMPRLCHRCGNLTEPEPAPQPERTK